MVITLEEKVQIAIKHLVPKQLEAHGFENEHVKLGSKMIEWVHYWTLYANPSGGVLKKMQELFVDKPSQW